MAGRGEDDRERARAAKREVARLLATSPAVCAIGLTRTKGRYAVKVVSAEPLTIRLPASIGGVPVVSETAGTVRKRATARRLS